MVSPPMISSHPLIASQSSFCPQIFFSPSCRCDCGVCGVRRYQEESRDGLDVLDEQTVMGTDGEDFGAARARLARGQGNKQAKQASRATELMAREEQRKQQFMASLGVDLTKVARTMLPIPTVALTFYHIPHTLCWLTLGRFAFVFFLCVAFTGTY